MIKKTILIPFIAFSNIIIGQSKNHIDTLSGFDSYVLGSSKYNYLPLDSNNKSRNWFYTKRSDVIIINDPDGTYFLGRQYSSTELAFHKNKLIAIYLSSFPAKEATIGGGIAQKVINRGISEYGMFSNRIVTPDCIMYIWADQKTTLTIRFTRQTFTAKIFGNSGKEDADLFEMDVTFNRE